MNLRPNKIPSIRLLLVAAAGMAVAGYCLSPLRQKVASQEVFVPERRERNLPANDHSVNPTSLVRLFPGGALDEARQWQDVRNLSLKEVKAAIEQLPQTMHVWTEQDPASVKAWLGRDDLPPAVIEDRDDYLQDALEALDRQ